MLDARAQNAEVTAAASLVKGDDMKAALVMQNAKQHELLKLQANWAQKRKVAATRESVFENSIVPQQIEKQRFADQLHLKYKQEKEVKYQEEMMKRSAVEWNLKDSHMKAIAVQLKE